MNKFHAILQAGFNPVFIFKLLNNGKAADLIDLNQPALDLLDNTRENIFLLKDTPAEWFPFLATYVFQLEDRFKILPGQLFTHYDDILNVEIKPHMISQNDESYLVLTVREVQHQASEQPNQLHFGNVSIIAEGSRITKLILALNAAAEKMDIEISPEGIFDAVKNQFKKLGFSCSIYLTTADLKFIYPKYMSYNPLIIKLAGRLFGVNPYEFMIPIDKTAFSRKLVFKRETLFVEDPRNELAELFKSFPNLSPISGRIIEWMSRFLKKTISSPLVIDDHVFGALTVHSDTLEKRDKMAISAFAHQVATAIHKAMLFQDLQKNLAEKERVEKALRVSEARLNLAFEAANDAIWDYSLQTKQIYLGPRWYGILGYESWEIKPDIKTWLGQIHPDDLEIIKDTYRKCLANPTRKFSVEYRIKNKKGEWLYLRSKAKFVDNDQQGNPTRFVGISSDITEQKAAEKDLIHLAFHDTLTGLMNRKAFAEKSDELLTSLRRKEDSALIAYFYLDLDHFKDVNDTFGHNVGDECLKLATKRILDTIRESDLLFRLGGDEFFLILKELKRPTDASLIADKLVKSFLKPFYWNQQPVYLHLSVGISLFPKDGTETWQLLSNSDTALYKAKTERNTYRFYDEAMQIEAIKKITIVNNIRSALENNEFQMFYQPILTCDGKLVAAEALIRWFGADGNSISPTSFIPWAEESGLIIPIGFNVFSMVVNDMAEWNKENLCTFPVSINISAKQLKQQELIPTMEKLLQSKNLDPALFHLEITESSLMENLDEILVKLDILKKSGLKFSIDDFGTGYSSLSYLKKLPIDILKIDRSFVTGLPNEQDSVIIKTIISMAQQLELKVIAEGVETQSQFEFLKTNGRPLVQGYYFSKPLPKEEFVRFIHQNNLMN